MSLEPAQLDLTFSALADPTRRAILSRLMAGDASVAELAEPFSISQPAVSKHLKALERAGLVTRSREATRRPVRIAAAPLAEATDWLQNFRRFWEGSYGHLDQLLADLQASPSNKDQEHG